jgi:hypothetical protein
MPPRALEVVDRWGKAAVSGYVLSDGEGHGSIAVGFILDESAFIP